MKRTFFPIILGIVFIHQISNAQTTTETVYADVDNLMIVSYFDGNAENTVYPNDDLAVGCN